MRGIVLSIFIMVAVVNCGDGSISDNGGNGGQSITPVDKQSVTSLYGTYTITSYKSSVNGTETVYTGDNLTGELIIDGHQVRFRVEYDDGVNRYYNFNHLFYEMSRAEYESFAYAIKDNKEGYFIKSAYEIQLGRFGLQKISDNPKSLGDNFGPYNQKLTPVRSFEPLPGSEDVYEWNTKGTYMITRISNETYPLGFTSILMGLVSFNPDNASATCRSVKGYMPWKKELPSSIGGTAISCNFMLYWQDSKNMTARFSFNPNTEMILEKITDAVLED